MAHLPKRTVTISSGEPSDHWLSVSQASLPGEPALPFTDRDFYERLLTDTPEACTWSRRELHAAKQLDRILGSNDNKISLARAVSVHLRHVTGALSAHRKGVTRCAIEPLAVLHSKAAQSSEAIDTSLKRSIGGYHGTLLWLLGLDDESLDLLSRVNYCQRTFSLVRCGVLDEKRASIFGGCIAAEETLSKLTPNPLFDRLMLKQPRMAWLLYCGVKPVELAQGYLAAHEAHRWLEALASSNTGLPSVNPRSNVFSYNLALPLHWLAWSLGIEPEIYGKLRDTARDMIVWLASKLQGEALKKQRVQYLPGGIEQTYRLLDLIDEVRSEDLVNGTKTSVETVFRRVTLRHQALYELEAGKNVPLPKEPFKGTEEIVPLTTSLELWAEGKFMQHCVGGYGRACLAGTSAIYSVRTDAGRSTLELARAEGGRWRLAQHKSIHNHEPAPYNQEIVQVWAKQMGVLH